MAEISCIIRQFFGHFSFHISATTIEMFHHHHHRHHQNNQQNGWPDCFGDCGGCEQKERRGAFSEAVARKLNNFSPVHSSQRSVIGMDLWWPCGRSWGMLELLNWVGHLSARHFSIKCKWTVEKVPTHTERDAPLANSAKMKSGTHSPSTTTEKFRPRPHVVH